MIQAGRIFRQTCGALTLWLAARKWHASECALKVYEAHPFAFLFFLVPGLGAAVFWNMGGLAVAREEAAKKKDQRKRRVEEVKNAQK